jgi:hypothetical protein
LMIEDGGELLGDFMKMVAIRIYRWLMHTEKYKTWMAKNDAFANQHIFLLFSFNQQSMIFTVSNCCV